MEPLEQKLVLTREIQRLSVNEKQLAEKVKRLEVEQLELVDLKSKAQKELTDLNEKKSLILKEITQEKGEWSQEKAYEEEMLNKDKIETRKILNREEYVSTQESKLKSEDTRLEGIRQDIAQREKALEEGMEFLRKEKKQTEQFITETQKTVDELKASLETIKIEAIEKIKLL